MKGEPRRHERDETLTEKHAHLVQDSADGQKRVKQSDTSEDGREYIAQSFRVQSGKENAPPGEGGAFEFGGRLPAGPHSSQLKTPPVLYSVTRVSKKFFSFFKSITSLIHGNGLATL